MCYSHQFTGVIRVVPRILQEVRQSMSDISILVEHLPSSPRRRDVGDIVIMGVLRPEQTDSGGTTDRDGGEEVVVVYSFVD